MWKDQSAQTHDGKKNAKKWSECSFIYKIFTDLTDSSRIHRAQAWLYAAQEVLHYLCEMASHLRRKSRRVTSCLPPWWIPEFLPQSTPIMHLIITFLKEDLCLTHLREMVLLCLWSALMLAQFSDPDRRHTCSGEKTGDKNRNYDDNRRWCRS